MRYAKQLLSNPLISGSSIIFLGTFFANLFNYGFSLIMGRLLHVTDYGLVISFTSIITIFVLFQTAFANIFAKFSAQYYTSHDEKKLKLLINGGLQVVVVFGFCIFLLLIIFYPLIASFLKFDSFLAFLLVAFYIFISVIYSLPYGILQGELRFFSLSALNIVSSVTKIIAGTVFIYLGLNVFGALSGYVVSVIVPMAIGAYLIFNKTPITKQSLSTLKLFVNDFKKYSFYFLLASLGIAVFNSMDVVLVRGLFDSVTAGQFAALSLMGKSIFYLTSPIYFVFFPLIAKKNELKEQLTPTLLLAGFIVLALSGSVSLFYFLFPHLVVSIFFPAPEYAMLSQYVGLYSLFIVIFSLAFLLNNFFLSVGKTAVYKINLLCAGVLIALFFIFHNSLLDVVVVLISMSVVLCVSLLIYYFYSYARN